MKKFYKILALLLLVSLLFSSCSGSEKTSDLTIVQALGIDEENGKTKITFQYLDLNPSTSGSNLPQGKITAVTSGRGSNISASVFSASKKLSNEIFFAQNKLVVFSSDYAKNSIERALEYLLESESSRPDVIAAISKSSAEEIIKSEENGAKIPAENIYNLLRLSEENGCGGAVTICDLLNLYNDATSDIWLPVLKANKKGVSCGETAVFSKEKYVKTLSAEQTLGFLLAKNKVKSSLISVNSPAPGKTSLKIIKAKTKKNARIKNNVIFFDIKISLEMRINESQSSIGKAISKDEYTELQKSCEKRVSALCKSAVEECFNSGSDPFMLGRYVYMQDKKLYNSLKDNWREEIKNARVTVEVHAEIQRVG